MNDVGFNIFTKVTISDIDFQSMIDGRFIGKRRE